MEFWFVFICQLYNISLQGQELAFAVVGKQISPYYLKAKQDCLAATQKLSNVQCIFRSPIRTDVRLQNQIIEELVDQKVDGVEIEDVLSISESTET